MREHVGLDTTWCNGVYSDVLVTHISAERSDESLDGVLAASIERVILWSTGTSSNGGHQDDRALPLKMLVCLLGNKELRSGVSVEHIVVDLWGNLEKRGEVLFAGVGHDDIKTAEGLLALLEEPDDIWNLGNIGLNGNSVRAELLNLLNDGVGISSGISVVDNDLSASGSELKGDTSADTTAGTGDESNLALERCC